jgi:hypothetical protein
MNKKEIIKDLDNIYSSVMGIVKDNKDYQTIDLIQPILNKIDEVQNEIEDL